MDLKNLLSEKKAVILKRWFDTILQNYPDETSQFLKDQKDPFSNPVGFTIIDSIGGIFENLLSEGDIAAGIGNIPLFLDNIIRIRAVQDISPSQAIRFVFQLKEAIREEIKREIQEKQFSEELPALEAKIDAVAMLAFDIYMRCREKIYEISVNEIRNMAFKLTQSAGIGNTANGETG